MVAGGNPDGGIVFRHTAAQQPDIVSLIAGPQYFGISAHP
jgi:hypothetical protein